MYSWLQNRHPPTIFQMHNKTFSLQPHYVLIFAQKWEVNLIKIQVSEDWYISKSNIARTVYTHLTTWKLSKSSSFFSKLYIVTTIKASYQFCNLFHSTFFMLFTTRSQEGGINCECVVLSRQKMVCFHFNIT